MSGLTNKGRWGNLAGFKLGPEMPLPRLLSWTALISTLGLLLIGGLFYGRDSWPALLPGEATYLAQASSLLEDGDLRYERGDFERLLTAWGGEPTDLELATGSAGRWITFDRSFPYSLWLAPFMALLPRSGFALANALLLALAACAAGRVLQRRLGDLAPLWVTLLVLASTVFIEVFQVDGDLFLLALTVLAFSLIDDPQSGARNGMLAGTLLAVVFITEPLYLALLLAAWWIASRPAKRGLGLGFLAALLGLVLVGWWVGGGLTFVAVERFRFTAETGFPLLDFTAGEWRQRVRELAAFHWRGAPQLSWGLDLGLWWWNGIYLWLGRHIGLLPYFPALLLLALGWSRGRRGLGLALALMAWVVGLLLFEPFTLAGLGGTLGNGAFLPVFGALWFGLSGRLKTWLWGLPVLGLAVLFLLPMWLAPWMSPRDSLGDYRHLSAAAARLPFETSQRYAPVADEGRLNSFWVRSLAPSCWVESGRERLVMSGTEPVRLLVASELELDFLSLRFGAQAPSRLEVQLGSLEERVLQADGGILFRLRPSLLQRSHPSWWTPQRLYLYEITFELPDIGSDPLPFVLGGEVRGD